MRSVDEDLEKGNPHALLMGMESDTATVENSVEFHQIIKNRIAFNSVIPLLGLYTKTPEMPIRKYMHPCVQSSLIYNS